MLPRTCAALVLAAALARPAAAQDPQRSERFFDSDGVRLRYLVQGTGAPVVLLHGFALSAEMNWVGPGIVDSLAHHYTVIALDLRGHGGSAKPPDAAAYGAPFVADVVRLLDHLRIERAHVVGYSMGASIALKLLTEHPDRVTSAVLGGSGWVAPGTPPPPFLADWLVGLERSAREGTSVADVFERPDVPALRPELKAALDRNDPRALAAVLRGFGPGLAVTEAALRASTTPVRAVHGEHDPGARAGVDALKGVRADVAVTVIPGADHASAIADPRLAQAILAFLRAR